MNSVKESIPHRDPFLFVDRILALEGQKIRTEKIFPPTTDFYGGHYPGNPITPGVILCETVFQTAAILILKLFPLLEMQTPVLARIEDARFKSIVKPNELLKIEAELNEKIGKFFMMSGTISKEDHSIALKTKFALALVGPRSL
ncbi:MAG: beta-hydroxyacyl-ACP dehydratase [Puniceicoccales bacterium]|jgi:3-hydroxyacyl-[acyl-carrier-protein] dehydratase|nr:beta-hydroxyacyl-ACP dehydratase [Puniceicoccales bacterium]